MQVAVRSSPHKLTTTRVMVMLVLFLLSLVELETGHLFVGTLASILLVIVLGIYATRVVYDVTYRPQEDYLQASRVTTEVPIEIGHTHADRQVSSIVMQVKTGDCPSPIFTSLPEYHNSKVENGNAFLIGMNGSGKTELLRCLAKHIDPRYRVKVLDFKRKDRGMYHALGYERVEMRRRRVNPWVSKEAFKNALLVAIDLDESGGITANSVRPLLNVLIDKSNNWNELFINLKLAIKDSSKGGAEKGSLAQRGALLHIEEVLNAIYDPNAVYLEFTETNQYLDFSAEDEIIATVDAELYLAILYEKIVRGEVEHDFTFIVDECSHLLRNRYDNKKSVSVIEKIIAREIRATGSRIWLCSQLYTDIPAAVRDQCAAQYIFKTKDPETLLSLTTISELLSQAVADLSPFCFVDIGQDFRGERVRDAVYHFKLFPKKDEAPPTEPAKATPEPLLQLQGEVAPPITQPERLPQPPQVTAQLPANSNYLLRTAEMLEKKSMLTKEIATQHEATDHRPADAPEDWQPGGEQIRAMKLELVDQKLFLNLVSIDDGGFAGVILLQDEYKDKPQSLYYLIDKAERRVHTKLVEITKQKLIDRQIPIGFEGKNHTPVSEVDFEISSCILEVETSLKEGNVKDLVERIRKAKKQVLVIAPNDDTKKRYTGLLAQQLQDGKARVLVLYELGYFLDHLQQNIAVTSSTPLKAHEREPW
jgi:energy-coupling factor transporter ATP-binding protein EcfA2